MCAPHASSGQHEAKVNAREIFPAVAGSESPVVCQWTPEWESRPGAGRAPGGARAECTRMAPPWHPAGPGAAGDGAAWGRLELTRAAT
jgi:hypothetical protein